MKKILFLLIVLVVSSVSIVAQDLYTTVGGTNATLLQPAGSYLYYGSEVMNKKECVAFLKDRHQPAYEKFQSGYKCYQAGWSLFGAGLGFEFIGSMLLAFAPENNKAMTYSGDAFVIAGSATILASIPTIFIGYSRMNTGIDMFNMTQVNQAPRAYWTIQGSENGLGLALHF